MSFRTQLVTLSVAPSGSPADEQPAVLSYIAMRRAAGYIGLALPLAVVIVDLASRGCLPSSISGSYYTAARNFFIGSLCSVGVFLITSLGYREDWPYSLFAGTMAFLVAFFPTGPDSCCSFDGAHLPFEGSNLVHAGAAIALFLTLAWFCLVLFCRSSDDPHRLRPRWNIPFSPQKQKRNRVFIICGCTMLAAMAYYAVVMLLKRFGGRAEPHYALLVVEWICLWAFGVAWLVKGQQMFGDVVGTTTTSVG